MLILLAVRTRNGKGRSRPKHKKKAPIRSSLDVMRGARCLDRLPGAHCAKCGFDGRDRRTGRGPKRRDGTRCSDRREKSANRCGAIAAHKSDRTLPVSSARTGRLRRNGEGQRVSRYAVDAPSPGGQYEFAGLQAGSGRCREHSDRREYSVGSEVRRTFAERRTGSIVHRGASAQRPSLYRLYAAHAEYLPGWRHRPGKHRGSTRWRGLRVRKWKRVECVYRGRDERDQQLFRRHTRPLSYSLPLW